MNDDRRRRVSDQEAFEAIVARLHDPEMLHIRRVFLVLGITVYLAAALALTTAGGFGWPGVIGFTATFVPGLVVAWRRHRHSFAVGLTRA